MSVYPAHRSSSPASANGAAPSCLSGVYAMHKTIEEERRGPGSPVPFFHPTGARTKATILLDLHEERLGKLTRRTHWGFRLDARARLALLSSSTRAGFQKMLCLPFEPVRCATVVAIHPQHSGSGLRLPNSSLPITMVLVSQQAQPLQNRTLSLRECQMLSTSAHDADYVSTCFREAGSVALSAVQRRGTTSINLLLSGRHGMA
jgi:hypothetical protein